MIKDESIMNLRRAKKPENTKIKQDPTRKSISWDDEVRRRWRKFKIDAGYTAEQFLDELSAVKKQDEKMNELIETGTRAVVFF